MNPGTDGGPAFPGPDDYTTEGAPVFGPIGLRGMSLRDWFAGRVIADCVRYRTQLAGDGRECYDLQEVPELAAVDAYMIADAMVAARSGTGASCLFDLIAHLRHQREWSCRTFGPGARTAGVIDHIRKELDEIAADPTDIAEWVDVVILAFDGAWRAGWEPEAIVAAIAAKQRKNEGRTWPDWRTADPDKAIEHDRSFDVVGGKEGA